jgi:hypothetical protein
MDVRPGRFAVRGARTGIILFVVAALACGGGGVPTGPGAPTSSVDLTKLRTFLGDPFVRLLPTLLADVHPAAEVDASMRRLRERVTVGQPAAVSAMLDSAALDLAAYTAIAALGPGDPVVLDALNVVLLKSHVLLEESRAGGPAPLTLD